MWPSVPVFFHLECFQGSFITISFLFIVRKEKAMATHSSTLAWKIPWMEKPCRLQSLGSLGVGHD